jgi:uncharacterized membrane protein
MPTSRIEAFSDGVFAIIVTLLVLEIHVPQVQGQDISAALERSLLAMAPKFLSYILSFVIVCIWWVAHHHLFHILKRSDRGLLWLNSLFLLWLAFIPFPTALMGDFPGVRLPVVCYGALTTLAGVRFLPNALLRILRGQTARRKNRAALAQIGYDKKRDESRSALHCGIARLHRYPALDCSLHHSSFDVLPSKQAGEIWVFRGATVGRYTSLSDSETTCEPCVRTKRWDNGGSQTLFSLALKKISFFSRSAAKLKRACLALPVRSGRKGNLCCRNRRLGVSILLPEPFRAETGADQIWFSVVLLGQSDAD